MNKITSLTQIDWSQYKKGDVVAFDLDETIFTFVQKIMRGFNGYQKDLLTSIKAIGGTPTEVFNAVSHQLIEDVLPSIIAELGSRGVEVIGFTARHTGSHQLDPKPMVERTNETLNKVGVSFHPTIFKDWVIPNSNTTDHPELVVDPYYKYCSDGGNAGIYNGIIYTNNLDKGYILGKIFDHFDFQPARFDLFDDRLANLETIQKILGDAFHGHHYLGASSLLDNTVDDYEEQKAYFLEHRKFK